MEFQFSVEIKQEGQIKQEPGIFNLVLSAQRHTHRASSWDKGEKLFSEERTPGAWASWRQLWEALLEPTGISICAPGFHVCCAFLHLSLREEAQNSTGRRDRDQGGRRQATPQLYPLPPTQLQPLGGPFQASPECPSFSLQVSNLPSPTHHVVPHFLCF